MELSFICVNYNSFELVQSLFQSLCPLLDKQDITYECIIIDQSENKDELERLKSLALPNMIINPHPNRGFGSGCNQGASIARGKYICFLNPDLIFNKFSWKEIKGFFYRKGENHYLGGRLFLPNGSLQVSTWWYPSIITESLRRIANRLSEKGASWWKKSLDSFSSRPRKVPWITGAVFLLPSHIFHRLEGFDEGFFLFFEDIDLCYRARKMGINGFWTPFIEAVHLESALTKKNQTRARLWYRESRNRFWKKHYSPLSCILLKWAEKISDLPFLR